MKIPLLGTVDGTELARSEMLTVVSCATKYPVDCHIRLFTEREEKEGLISHMAHLSYGNTPWNYRYRDSVFSETVFPWQVTGSLFFLEIFGTTNPEESLPLQIYHLYLKLKKERDK